MALERGNIIGSHVRIGFSISVDFHPETRFSLEAVFYENVYSLAHISSEPTDVHEPRLMALEKENIIGSHVRIGFSISVDLHPETCFSLEAVLYENMCSLPNISSEPTNVHEPRLVALERGNIIQAPRHKGGGTVL